MIDVPHALNPAGFEPCLTVCELCSAVPFSRKDVLAAAAAARCPSWAPVSAQAACARASFVSCAKEVVTYVVNTWLIRG